jgi:DNA polymerase III epsilon subunit-like protein
MARTPRPEVLISIDVEASGPSPGTGSLLSIGACLVSDPGIAFYREIRPIPGLPWDRAAERVHKLRKADLERDGQHPEVAMAEFADWVEQVADGGQPVFVGFNAPFDWMYVADYLHRFVGRNPFGYSALDLKAVYLGRHGVGRWAETTKEHVSTRHPVPGRHTHNALDDARRQALLARSILGPGVGAPPAAADGERRSADPAGSDTRRRADRPSGTTAPRPGLRYRAKRTIG